MFLMSPFYFKCQTRATKYSYLKMKIDEIYDPDTNSDVPSVLRTGRLVASFQFHHDPETTAFFEQMFKSEQFTHALQEQFSSALKQTMWKVKGHGAERWSDDQTVHINQLVLNREEVI